MFKKWGKRVAFNSAYGYKNFRNVIAESTKKF